MHCKTTVNGISCIEGSVKAKNSSQKILWADCRPTVGPLSLDCWPTVGYQLAKRQQTVGRQLAHTIFWELFFTFPNPYIHPCVAIPFFAKVFSRFDLPSCAKSCLFLNEIPLALFSCKILNYCWTLYITLKVYQERGSLFLSVINVH